MFAGNIVVVGLLLKTKQCNNNMKTSQIIMIIIIKFQSNFKSKESGRMRKVFPIGVCLKKRLERGH